MYVERTGQVPLVCSLLFAALQAVFEACCFACQLPAQWIASEGVRSVQRGTGWFLIDILHLAVCDCSLRGLQEEKNVPGGAGCQPGEMLFFFILRRMIPWCQPAG